MNLFRAIALLLTLALLLPAAVSCSNDEQGINESGFKAEICEETTNYVLLDISYTTSENKQVTEKLVIELRPDIAPITVQNFKDLVADGFYDDLTFHRVYKGFMIQGGDPDGNGTGGSANAIVGEFSENGFQNSLSHKRGVVSMARSDHPNSASSQFFIVHEDSTFLDGKYAAFGTVIYGMSTVDGIARTRVTYNSSGEKSSPINSVTINYARFVTVSGDAASTVELSAVETFVPTTTTAEGTTAPQEATTTVTTTEVPVTTVATTEGEPTSASATTETTSAPIIEPEPPLAQDFDFSALNRSDYEVTQNATNLVLLTITYSDEYGATKSGEVVFRLFSKAAPLTVAHFQSLVTSNAYQGATFSRIVCGTALFGGIQNCETVTGEFASNGVQNPISHERGIVSMMRSGNNDSATGEFFILQRDYRDFDGSYAAFAFVAYGMDTVDAIAGTPLQFNPSTSDQTAPISPVTIVSAEFLAPREA